MFEPGPNDTLSQNFMKLGLLVAEKNVDRHTHTHTHTHTQDLCFISIDIGLISKPSSMSHSQS